MSVVEPIDSEQASTRLLFGLRLFSGLAESLATGVWKPTGVPAIYTLLEGAGRRADIQTMTVFTVKDRKTAAQFGRTAHLHVPEIGPVVIWPYRQLPFAGLDKLELLLTEADHAIRFLWLYRRFRPDTSYFSAVNVLAAALFARLGLGQVQLRLMGIMPEHRSIIRGGRPFRRMLYKAPFSRVICTQEGSGAERILPCLLARETPWEVLLNGVDQPPDAGRDAVDAMRAGHRLDERPIVLFVGRLVDYKGCSEFVDAMIQILSKDPRKAQAVLVGTGTMDVELKERVHAAHRDRDVRFLGAVPHEAVTTLLSASDIYVSLNRHGNLSNANLEALASGCCMVLPECDPHSGIDEKTSELIPPSVAPRVSRQDTVAALAERIEDLLADPERRARQAIRAREQAAKILGSWDERVALELSSMSGETPTHVSADTPSTLCADR